MVLIPAVDKDLPFQGGLATREGRFDKVEEVCPDGQADLRPPGKDQLGDVALNLARLLAEYLKSREHFGATSFSLLALLTT